MAKQAGKLTFTFINPNTPEKFQGILQKLLLEKLCAPQSELASKSRSQ